MIRIVTALLVLAFAAAQPAGADPSNLVPGCTGGQVAAPGACTSEPGDAAGLEALGGIPGAFPGANPNIPPAVLPFNFPVVVPLGVTPFQQPSNLPFGPTPPTALPFAP